MRSKIKKSQRLRTNTASGQSGAHRLIASAARPQHVTATARLVVSEAKANRNALARKLASVVAATFVREARAYAKMTKEQLARAIAVHPSRISDIENRRKRLVTDPTTGEQKELYDSVPLILLFEISVVTGMPLSVKAVPSHLRHDVAGPPERLATIDDDQWVSTK